MDRRLFGPAVPQSLSARQDKPSELGNAPLVGLLSGAVAAQPVLVPIEKVSEPRKRLPLPGEEPKLLVMLLGLSRSSHRPRAPLAALRGVGAGAELTPVRPPPVGDGLAPRGILSPHPARCK